MNRKCTFFLLSFFILSMSIGFGQTEPSDFTGRDSREREHASQTDRFNFVPNEIIVKFKDDVNLNGDAQLKSTGINRIDQVLKSANIEQMERLFPNAKKLKSAKVVKTPLGQEMVVPNLHNIYRITLPELKSNQPSQINIHEYIQELQQQPEVEYAEPNYIYSIGDFTPAGPEMTMLEAMEQPANFNISETSTGLIPSDPLYNSQWGIPATNIDDVWNTTTGDSTAVIAILDTGVDDDHPDLKDNIWENTNEIPGNGQDNDGNGKIDDIMGWDFINNDNDPKDDNSHGTHVAGIAAAVGDNGIGIAGVNWKAKIMPVKVFQSSGRGDAATIAQGISYAAENGATVLNMSFGSYAESFTMKNALASAYATAVLVAAAGNDALCIGPGLCPDMRLGAPIYPGAFPFVLGVEANGTSARAGFSNFDQDGPVFSQYADLLNYELKAPGTGILSCVPGGNYREYNGTSMAAPLVAGAVLLYRQQKPEESQELLFGNFIYSINQHINLEAALNIVPEPRLDIVSYEFQDTIDGDGDGRPDAGETLELFVKVRNTWGQADDVKVGIEFNEFENPTVAEILTSEANVGSVSPYASRINSIPLRLKIATEIANDRDIVLNLKTWYDENDGMKSNQIILKTENACNLSGIISDTLVINSKCNWIINNSLKIAPTGVLLIKPRTYLDIRTNITNDGTIIANGTSDSLITIKTRNISNGLIIGKFVDLEINRDGNSYAPPFNIELSNSIISAHGTYAIEIKEVGIFRDCIIKESSAWNLFNTMSGQLSFTGCLFKDFGISNAVIEAGSSVAPKPNVSYSTFLQCGNVNNRTSLNLVESNFLAGSILYAEKGYNQDVHNQYWGTMDSLKIIRKIFDFYDDASLALIDFTPYLIAPTDSAHAIVWKVLLNGKDAQDEEVDPVGVGIQRFDVYFNRPMDTTFIPQISFGVREPFNQQMVNEDGSWSDDSLIYTAYKTIKLTTGDGINRIRVSGAKEADGWDWEIPVEDQRFEFLISAASSASNEFMASPGLGKVDLEWNNNDLEDGLGYNMYRMEQINDSTLSQPVMINSMLITDTLYTDYAVIPNKKYFYYYKILRTNLEETDSSRVVSAIPFTASLGDANGDLLVNVSDIVTVVNYIMENNPAPFIHEAADINGDDIINVLDIVGLVNIILAPQSQSLKGLIAEEAQISVEDGIVYVTSPVKIVGIQFTLADINSGEELEILEALKGFEIIRTLKNEKLIVIAYSLSGKTIPPGKTALLKIKNEESWIFDAILSNIYGKSIDYTLTDEITATEIIEMNSDFILGQNYPNPFTGNTTIPFELGMNVEEAVLSIYDITGREIKTWQLKNLNRGLHLVEWSGDGRNGIYIYKMYVKKDGQRSYPKAKKMIVR
jgi:subtilisin family serine protease